MAVNVQCGGEGSPVRDLTARGAPAATTSGATVALAPCRVPGIDSEVRCGTLEVVENRDARAGRRLQLDIVVLPARSGEPVPDPVFFVAGGPGQAATMAAPGLWSSPLRERRDVVLVDTRGSGGSHALDCALAGSDENLQGYFDPIFQTPLFETCRRQLEQRADLRWYTTAAAMDDLDDARAALGYERINLVGRSYGTRASLVYARRHPTRTRTAFLTGLVPTAFRNPLHHARAAQDALELLIAACERDARCRASYPELRRDLETVVQRLDSAPARVTIPHPTTGAMVEIRLSRVAFGEAVRVMMYQTGRAMRLPLLIHRASRGDFVPFAELGLASNRGLRGALRAGLLMSVVCSEDVPRITEADIVRETRGTMLGDTRVREQMAACGVWPRGEVADGHADPVAVRVPMLLVTGSLDPVTPPVWGDEAARHLPNGLHIVIPGGHAVASPCLDRIAVSFLEQGTVSGLDTTCVETLALPPFVLPEVPDARTD
ncbi:MAG TPA: alpha/beta hydrolase [Gemmatimonadaceae bacterium]|nr:alpha/beta hydrolase [Gemmatimonadaceae bacterium]